MATDFPIVCMSGCGVISAGCDRRIAIRSEIAQLARSDGVPPVNPASPTMQRPFPQDEDSLESDAVWKLLDEASTVVVSPRFADSVMRAVRLDEAPAPWWKRFALPLSLGGLTAATAALALTVHALFFVAPEVPTQVAAVTQAEVSFAGVQEAADSEALVAAADHLDKFSDTELVSLIGF